jgi:hypothetical protein
MRAIHAVVLALLLTRAAVAQTGSSIGVEPPVPNTQTPVTLLVGEWDRCPSAPIATRSGFTITVPLGSGPCLTPAMLVTHRIELGTLPAGRYTVIVDDEGEPRRTATFEVVQPGQGAVTTILVPTLYNGPGAFGTQWWSMVAVDNQSSRPFSSPGVSFTVLGPPCGIPEGCTTSEIAPGRSGVVASPLPATGLLLYSTADLAHDLAFRGRFGSGNPGRGTSSELPIVREAEFSRRAIRLPYVTIHNTRTPIRSALRIYGPDAIPGTTVRVQLRHAADPAAGAVVAERIVQLGVPHSIGPFWLYPAFAQLALQHEFPEALVRGSTFTITVTPLPHHYLETTPRIWAFISTTENDTQEVETQRPQ